MDANCAAYGSYNDHERIPNYLRCFIDLNTEQFARQGDHLFDIQVPVILQRSILHWQVLSEPLSNHSAWIFKELIDSVVPRVQEE